MLPQDTQFEKKALLVKIDNLNQWLRLYRDQKIKHRKSLIDIQLILNISELELKKFI